MRTTVTMKFDFNPEAPEGAMPGLVLAEIDGVLVLRPITVQFVRQGEGLDYRVRYDGAPVGIKGELPDLDVMLDAFNARRKSV